MHEEWLRKPQAFYSYVRREVPCPSLEERVTLRSDRRIRRFIIVQVDRRRPLEPGNIRWYDRLTESAGEGEDCEPEQADGGVEQPAEQLPDLSGLLGDDEWPSFLFDEEDGDVG